MKNIKDSTLDLDKEYTQAVWDYFFYNPSDTPELRKVFEDGYSQGAKDALKKIGEMIEEWTGLKG